MKIYQVGGSVRDQILGKTPKDRDWLVVNSSVENMLRLGYKPVGKDFPVFLHPQTKEEYALARVERKIENKRGHGDFSFYYAPDVSVEDDLLRRDLTINAIAIDDQGKLVDPFGGEQDIKNKILRNVSKAFSEDPLRILRVARFSAQLPEFTIADETLLLMQKMVANEDLAFLSAERIWQELVRGLAEKKPRKMFEILSNIGALKKILPEVDNLKGVPQKKSRHPEKDVFEHTMLTMEAITKLTTKPHIRFAALCHDLGKAMTAKEYLPAHPNHHLQGVNIIEKLAKRLKIPSKFNHISKLSCRWHDAVFKLEQDPKNLELWFDLITGIDLWRRPWQLDELLLVANADFQGRPNYLNTEFKFINIAKKISNQVKKSLINQMITDKNSRDNLIRLNIEKAVFNMFA